MFDEHHYVPILKGRAGELGALREADERVRDATTPLIEIPPLPWDFEAEQPAKQPAEHVAAFSRALAQAVGFERRLFLDGGLLSEQDLVDGDHGLRAALLAAREAGVAAVPVAGLRRGERYEQAVAEAVQRDGQGVCLRLDSDDLEEPEDLADALNGARAALGLSAKDIDLVLDLGAVVAEQRWIGATVRLLIGALPDADLWRSLTVAASSFPVDLSGVAGDSVALIPRAEWTGWLGLYARRERLARMPTFGDYGIGHPVQRELDPRIIQMSAAIRYTTDEDFMVVKGRSVRMKGFEQFFDLSAELVGRQEFHGEGFSWGDDYVARTARREDGPGNAATWRRVGTSQHLALVTSQLAELRDA